MSSSFGEQFEKDWCPWGLPVKPSGLGRLVVGSFLIDDAVCSGSGLFTFSVCP